MLVYDILIKLFTFALPVFSFLILFLEYNKTKQNKLLFFSLPFIIFFFKDLIFLSFGAFSTPTLFYHKYHNLKLFLELSTMTFFYSVILYYYDIIKNWILSINVFIFLLIIALKVYNNTTFNLPFVFPRLIFVVLIIFNIALILNYRTSYYYTQNTDKPLFFIFHILSGLIWIIYLNSFAIKLNPYLCYIPFYLSGLIIAITNTQSPYNQLKSEYQVHMEEHSRVIEMMNTIGLAIAQDTNFDKLLDKIIESLMKATDAVSGAIFLYNKTKNILAARSIIGPFPPVLPISGHITIKTEYISAKIKATEIKMGETYIGKIAQSLQPLWLNNFENYSDIIKNASQTIDINSLIAIPLIVKNELLGVISIINKQNNKTFTSTNFSIAKTIAEQAALNIDNVVLYNEYLEKQKTEKEIEIAANIQKNLFPKEIPTLKNAYIYSFSHPARIVGGDYFDVLNFQNGKVGIFICDVVGKGIPAALIMVMVKSLLHVVAGSEIPAKDVIKKINYNLCKHGLPDTFATVGYMIYDDQNSTFTYSNAGHHPLLYYHIKKNDFSIIDTPGLPVGIDYDTEYSVKNVKMNPGDTFVFYTDGIIEAMNEKGEQFSEEKLKEIIKNNGRKGIKAIGVEIINNLKVHTNEMPQHDDQTLILIRQKNNNNTINNFHKNN